MLHRERCRWVREGSAASREARAANQAEARVAASVEAPEPPAAASRDSSSRLEDRRNPTAQCRRATRRRRRSESRSRRRRRRTRQRATLTSAARSLRSRSMAMRQRDADRRGGIERVDAGDRCRRGNVAEVHRPRASVDGGQRQGERSDHRGVDEWVAGHALLRFGEGIHPATTAGGTRDDSTGSRCYLSGRKTWRNPAGECTKSL